MNNNIKNIILIVIILAIGWLFIKEKPSNLSDQASISNTEIKNNIQYVTIHAKGGYTPKTTIASSGIPTKLIIKTNGTFDCSASLAIRSIGYQKILPQNGTETIDIGTPKAGEKLQGVCSMGMYSFVVNFK